MKVITWVDLQGRYRTTSPAYGDPTRPSGETEGECIARVLVKIRAHYGLPDSHEFHLVEDADQRARLAECCGTHFRYGAIARPNREGRIDAEGAVILCRDGRDGAWEMDVDGRPKVNMVKARGVHMDHIREARNAKLAELDVPYMRALEAGDTAEQQRIATRKQVLRDIPQTFRLSAAQTPVQLGALWPPELKVR